MNKIIVFILFGLFSFSTSVVFSQIESGKITPEQQVTKKKKRPKKERIPRTDEEVKEAPFLFIGAGAFQSNTINKATHTIFSKPLGIKEDEKAVIVPVVGISYKIVLKNGFFVNFGLDYSQSGEKFDWKSTTSDSSFSYQNKYHLLSVPLGVNYIYGKKVQLITGLGFAPNLTFGSKNKTQIVTTQKDKIDTKTQIQDRMNDFNIYSYFQLGVQFRLTRGVYFYLLPEIRYSLFNTLNKQASYHRNYWQIGAHAGISFKI